MGCQALSHSSKVPPSRCAYACFLCTSGNPSIEVKRRAPHATLVVQVSGRVSGSSIAPGYHLCVVLMPGFTIMPMRKPSIGRIHLTLPSRKFLSSQLSSSLRAMHCAPQIQHPHHDFSAYDLVITCLHEFYALTGTGRREPSTLLLPRSRIQPPAKNVVGWRIKAKDQGLTLMYFIT